MKVVVVGGGLAGCEAAFQLAERGIDVELVEQKPRARTPAHNSDKLCELVCSNSMRGAALVNAVGLLKEELRRAGSLVMRCAEIARVPAGGALAVDRASIVGAEHLAYYDAIAPIVSADSIDWSKVWKQSRWGKGSDEGGE